jgi:acyl carrier protein
LKEVLLVEALEDSLINYLQNKFGMRPRREDSLAMLGVDSVSMAELTFDIEKMYGITVDDMMSVDTVQDLLDYIRKRQSTPAEQSPAD